ncbi:ribose 5-phosphate isomerase B [Puniceicoccus vermicola]|uniref:Ribose 5-phosphate isomerase B n=1 Tax=Puniceicoccus vermicola TaxID=388746 RepID=A0A7X1AYA6_9BACT|nr:ribose 5-phosphate isomerase B [Puniceicoccus vermicola]MBC2602187.1 ribose 5-phosphate isomerase B [Puniceicoccus vermicola]
MKISLGTDHAGYTHKEAVKKHLEEAGYEVLDFGTNSVEAVDYPDFIRPAAEAVPAGKADRAIVFGGSGNGEAITANKVKGIRCALCWNIETGELAKQHNDANCLSFGARQTPVDEVLKIIDAWLAAKFEGGRHERRIQKIEN